MQRRYFCFTYLFPVEVSCFRFPFWVFQRREAWSSGVALRDLRDASPSLLSSTQTIALPTASLELPGKCLFASRQRPFSAADPQESSISQLWTIWGCTVVWFECEMSSLGSQVWTLGPCWWHCSGGRAWTEEVDHWAWDLKFRSLAPYFVHSLLPDCGYNVTSCFELPQPSLPHYEGLCSLELWAEINPPLGYFLSDYKKSGS